MEVYITVDTECREERLTRGRICPPLGYDIMMRGRIDGTSRPGVGTELLVSELGRYGFHGTFFMEPLCAEFFGIDGLASVCRDLKQSGQDLQLHLHPNFRRPEWRHQGMKPLPDDIADYDLLGQEALLTDAVTHLERAGVPRSTLVAFRAGNYGANNLTFEALRNVGLHLDSSFNLWGVQHGWCKIKEQQKRNDLYQAIPGVWELPVSCFADASGYRHLEITAISAAEMRYGLNRLYSAGARCATIITHPSEFFVMDTPERGRPNKVNIWRLRRLLAFLDHNRDRFCVRTVKQLVADLRSGKALSEHPTVVPRGSAALRLARIPVQAFKQIVMRPRGA